MWGPSHDTRANQQIKESTKSLLNTNSGMASGSLLIFGSAFLVPHVAPPTCWYWGSCLWVLLTDCFPLSSWGKAGFGTSQRGASHSPSPFAISTRLALNPPPPSVVPVLWDFLCGLEPGEPRCSAIVEDVFRFCLRPRMVPPKH